MTWISFSDEEVEIYATRTNAFKKGGVDKYELLGTSNAREESFSFKPAKRSKFYKILLKTKSNSVNVWWSKAGR